MFNYEESGMSFVASGDLSSMQGRIVDLVGATSKIGHALVDRGFGVLANKPRSGEHATVITKGVVKTKAGVAVSIGNYIYCAGSGWAGVATHAILDVASGSDYMQRNILGRALTAAASGFDFALDIEKHVTFVASA
jgi:hypothetical protein